MKIRLDLSTVAVLVAMMFTVNGCGGGGGSDNTPITGEKVTKLIEAESGGTVSLQNGTSLYIPPYALDEDKNISLSSVTISQFDSDPGVDSGVSGLYITGAVFEPDGTILDGSAVVRFPLPDDWERDETPVLYETQGNNPAEVLLSDTDAVIKEIDGGLWYL